ncbi:hypothetical protein HYU14_04750 [Candidatus Woesearchaeota archaeon]|nr:hypothetical protein [Candidatus Woesearchaeota archaeon]
MGDGKFSFFAITVILFIVLLGFTFTVFRLTGLPFVLEFLVLLFLMVIAFLALVPAYHGANSGWGFLALAFFVILADLFVISLRTGFQGKAMVLVALFSAIGFLWGVMKIKPKGAVHEEIKVPYEKEALNGKAAGNAKAAVNVKTEFSPGKFVASATGTVYHKANCDWAKKIQKRKQVWFDSAEEAKKQYKPHSCLRDE